MISTFIRKTLADNVINNHLEVVRLGRPVSGVWLLPDTPDGPFLIDSGFWTHRSQLLFAIAACGVQPKSLSGILLTHRHLDHAANAQWFHTRFGTTIYAHQADAQILRGKTKAPKLNEKHGFVGALSKLENNHPAQIPNIVDLHEGDTVAGLDVIWMPGHTIGSTFFYHRRSQTLFSGDTLLNAVPPYVQTTALSLPHAPFCDDYGKAIASLKRFVHLQLPVQTLCPGHGPTRIGNIITELSELLSEHD